MLTRWIARSDAVTELSGEYDAGVEYEYREAEYEIKIYRENPFAAQR